MRIYQGEPYENLFDNLNKVEKFLKNLNFPKVRQAKMENLNNLYLPRI